MQLSYIIKQNSQHLKGFVLQIINLMMLPPPGFCKPLWRGWEGAGRVRTDLAVAVAKIKHSIGGCHQEEVRREETHCPSSNQHHYVRQQPHRCEVLPQTTRKKESKGNVTIIQFLQFNCN